MFNTGFILSSPPSQLLSAAINPTSLCQNEIECPKIAHHSCHHCPKSLCLEHLNEHNTRNIMRAEVLSQELTDLLEIVSNLTTEKASENTHNKLDAWKNQMFDSIENMYKSRLDEINCLETELNQRGDILKQYLQSKLSSIGTQLLQIQTIGEISKKELSSIEYDFNQLTQFFESIQCELHIDTKNIVLKDLINVYNLFSCKSISPHRTPIKFYRTISVQSMKKFASSKENESILWLDNERKLHYIDRRFQTRILAAPQTLITSSIVLSDHHKRINNDDIVDIKWCSFPELFLVLLPRSLFSFDQKTNQFQEISVARHKNYPFRCISCFDNTLIYISYCTLGTYIELWKYSYGHENDIYMNECIKRWDCLTDDKNEWISHMNTNSNSTIGLLICRGSSIYRRFELRNENLYLLKIVQLENDYVDAFFPFQHNYWFIKSSSGKYYVYSVEKNTSYVSAFNFPFGVQEFGINSIVIGTEQEKLILSDI
ncbi:unnamed protein product [Rotaria socialis]|uniref:Uncharacterized protein n=1 Tax=Rotaria socialis TaxID=392032 RepID=A0A817PXF1_9BILA|nr:unnamed protein product [Rotaria socialis]CAF4323066.1 unnamed protein product [Rotaria socialis]